MLSEEEKKLLIIFKAQVEKEETEYFSVNAYTQLLYDSHKTVLNLITRLQKENEKKDEEIKELKENIDYQVLCDFLISSVPNEEPIWTEKHIEELLENFEMRWKNAYK